MLNKTLMFTFIVGCTESAIFMFPFIPKEYLNRFNIVFDKRTEIASGFSRL